MGGDWRRVPLGDVLELKRGYDLPERERQAGQVPIVSSSGVTGYHCEYKVPGPGVVTGRYGTIGQVFYIEEDFWPLNTTLYVRDFKGNDPRFISYLLRTVDFNAHNDKAAVPGVNRNHLHQALVDCPPLAEQRVIARILGSLDQKIQLSEELNRTLEATAQALFHYWFFEMGPFVSPEERNEGNLPEGWSSVSLLDVVELNPREALKKGEDVPYLEMADLPTNAVRPSPWRLRAFAAGSRFRDGDTLLARITPCLENGKTAYVDNLGNDVVGWGSTEFIVIRPKPPLPPEYGYLLARSPDFRTHAIQSMTGSSGRQRVQEAGLANFMVVKPPAAVAHQFGEHVKPLFNRIKANDEQSIILAEMRDALLPKLVSGELRLAEAEKQLEAV